MAEIKLELLFVTTASEAIKSLPAVAVLHRRMHRTLSKGPQARLGRGARLIGLRPLASDSSMRATESPNALLGTNTSQLTGNIEPPCGQSSHPEVQVGLTKWVFRGRP